MRHPSALALALALVAAPLDARQLATTAGLAALQRGGDTIDAAVTASAALAVVEPMRTGIGGDPLAIGRLAKEKRLVDSDCARALRRIAAEEPAAVGGGSLGRRVALELRHILEPYDVEAMGHGSPAYLHHLIEAKKLAYADLARSVGDADHLVKPVDRMPSEPFVADSAGDVVSFINRRYDELGSGIVAPGTGFARHDRGAGVTLDPGLPDMLAPRFRHLTGLRVALEAPLGAPGHEIASETQTQFGGAQAIVMLAKGWAAGSDPRKDGNAAGD